MTNRRQKSGVGSGGVKSGEGSGRRGQPSLYFSHEIGAEPYGDSKITHELIN